jgi:hypothetical protein
MTLLTWVEQRTHPLQHHCSRQAQALAARAQVQQASQMALLLPQVRGTTPRIGCREVSGLGYGDFLFSGITGGWGDAARVGGFVGARERDPGIPSSLCTASGSGAVAGGWGDAARVEGFVGTRETGLWCRHSLPFALYSRRRFWWNCIDRRLRPLL